MILLTDTQFKRPSIRDIVAEEVSRPYSIGRLFSFACHVHAPSSSRSDPLLASRPCPAGLSGRPAPLRCPIHGLPCAYGCLQRPFAYCERFRACMGHALVLLCFILHGRFNLLFSITYRKRFTTLLYYLDLRRQYIE